LRRLRNGGQTDRYRHLEPGVNSRLDEMQAAILRARLPRLRGWTARRRQLATRDRAALADAPAGLTGPPELDAGDGYHLFVVLSASRDELKAALAARGVETLIHYPVPIPRQPALAATEPAECPIAARIAGEVLSLPLHVALHDDEIDAVAAALKGHDACVH